MPTAAARRKACKGGRFHSSAWVGAAVRNVTSAKRRAVKKTAKLLMSCQTAGTRQACLNGGIGCCMQRPGMFSFFSSGRLWRHTEVKAARAAWERPPMSQKGQRSAETLFAGGRWVGG